MVNYIFDLFGSNKVKGNKKQRKAEYENISTYEMYLERLVNLAINMFEWKNLPETISERFLELTLCFKGLVLYFNDEEIGNLCLPCVINSPLDIYNIPIERKAYSNNGYMAFRNKENSVIIYNNYLHMPTILTLSKYARRLANIERTIDVNVRACKKPIILRTDKNTEFTVKQMYEQYDGNVPVIITDKEVINPQDTIAVYETNVEFIGDKLNELKYKYWNEVMCFLGINSEMDKKERLIKSEVSISQNMCESERIVMLNARKEAAKLINTKFGTNIEVDFRLNKFDNIFLGGGTIEQLHNNNT